MIAKKSEIDGKSKEEIRNELKVRVFPGASEASRRVLLSTLERKGLKAEEQILKICDVLGCTPNDLLL